MGSLAVHESARVVCGKVIKSERNGGEEMTEQISIFDNQSDNNVVLKCRVKQDNVTKSISNKFDYEFDGEIKTEIEVPEFPKDFNIGLIVGASGSGKSQLLKNIFGEEENIKLEDDKAIASCFNGEQDATDRLCATGLCSIPSWLKPYRVLSVGEKFRADLARRIKDGAVIDEFTSTVNREVAKSCSIAISKYIRKMNYKNVVFSSCHKDIIEYLQPDWVYDIDTKQFYTGRYLQRKRIELQILPCSSSAWHMFKRHHYLTGDMNKAADCYMAVMNDVPVGFVSVLAFPFGGCNNGRREHRLVVLPDFQGIGIGNALSEHVAKAYVDAGYRYFSKTANPKCGEHRDKSDLWKPTSHNHSNRKDYKRRFDEHSKYDGKDIVKHALRICYSHEYIGKNVQ